MNIKELFEGVEPELPGAPEGIQIMTPQQFIAKSAQGEEPEPEEEVSESKMAELDMDLDDPELSDREFEKIYGMSRREAREEFSQTNKWDFPDVRDPNKKLHEQGVAEGFPHDVDHMPGKTIKHQDTNCTTCHGRKSMYKLGSKLFADNKQGAEKVKCPTCKGTGDKPGVAEGAEQIVTVYGNHHGYYAWTPNSGVLAFTSGSNGPIKMQAYWDDLKGDSPGIQRYVSNYMKQVQFSELPNKAKQIISKHLLRQGMAEATGDERFDSMMSQITGGTGARQGVDNLNKSLTARSGSNPETALAKWGQEFIKWLEDICRNFSRQGVDRFSKLEKLSEFEDGGETMAHWLIEVAKQTKTSGITLADIQEFSSEFNTYGMWPWQQFPIAWSQGEWQDYKDQWTGPDGYIASLRQGVAEGGPFSYGKPPRKGSVAANAAQQRKEQDRKTPAIEPKDQRVGVAKVTKGVAEAWSQKYKNSINCSHPRGFSQKAHCAGKKKHSVSEAMEMTCPDCGMCKSHSSLTEIKKGQKDSNGYTKCWPGKHAEGTKTGKNGGQVRNCVPNEGVTEDFKMKSDFRKESDAALADFLNRGGEIKQVAPNRVRAKPGQGLASKHIGGRGETGRKIGKDRRVNGNKPVVNVSEVNDYFKRRKDEEDRIAGTKPPAKRTPQQTDYQNRRNKEKQVGEAKQKPSAQERFNNRLKTKHGIDLDAMERQWAERTKKIEAEIEALRKQEQQVSESYYQFDESWKSKLAGAALAGAAAFGGAAHAGGMSLPPAGLTPAQAQEFAATQMAGQQAINQHAAQQAGKIDYRKDGPITKSSLGHKLEYGIPVNAKGDFINPNRLPNIHELPMEEQQAMSDAYKTWLKDYLSRWPDARQQPDGSMQAIKPGLAPMYPK